MKIADVLDHLGRLEQTIGKLYEHFSAQFAENAAASDFFRKLASDEKSHYDLVAYQKRLVKGNEHLFNDIEFKPDEGERIINHAETLISAKTKLSLKEAANLAHKIEATAAEHHYKSVLGKSNNSITDFIKSLGSADQAHGEEIRKFIKSQNLD